MPQDQLFGRNWSVIVANKTNALDLSQMHITFQTTQNDVQTPNTCLVRIYNLSNATAIQLLSNEFNRVVIKAGYKDGPYGTIFDGTIKQTRKGRENQTDTYLDILGGDGDEAYNFSGINQTLDPANATTQDQINAAVTAMSGYNIDPGYVSPEFANATPQLIRGKVMYGMTRDTLRQISQAANGRWSLQNGKLILLANTGYIESDPIVISSSTGMIGIPEQTQSGIMVRSLLNPKLVIGQSIRISPEDVNAALFPQVPYGSIDISKLPANLLPKLSTTGLYRILVSECNGDTRGDDWYSDLVCLSIDPAVAPGKSVDPYP